MLLRKNIMKMIYLLLLITTYSTLTYADEISLASDLWCPYACDPKSSTPGFMVEISKTIFEKAGHKVSYKLLNWARAIADTRKGKFTAIVGASRSDAPDFLIPSIEIGHNSNYVWVLKNEAWEYKNIDSIKNKKIGVINTYSYGKEIDGPVQSKNPAFMIVSGDDALIKMIRMTKAKRLDGFIENPNVLAYNLKNLPEFQDQFKNVGKDVCDDSQLFVAFNPNNPKAHIYSELLAKGMVELRKSGKLQEILSKYGLKDWR